MLKRILIAIVAIVLVVVLVMVVFARGGPWTDDFGTGQLRIRAIAVLEDGSEIDIRESLTSFNPLSIQYEGQALVGFKWIVEIQSSVFPPYTINNDASFLQTNFLGVDPQGGQTLNTGVKVSGINPFDVELPVDDEFHSVMLVNVAGSQGYEYFNGEWYWDFAMMENAGTLGLLGDGDTLKISLFYTFVLDVIEGQGLEQVTLSRDKDSDQFNFTLQKVAPSAPDGGDPPPEDPYTPPGGGGDGGYIILSVSG